jgi:hypothetical protein
MSSRDMSEYAAMRPYFEVVTQALTGLVDGTDFFDMHAEDVVVEFVIAVPDDPRRIVGRDIGVVAALQRSSGRSARWTKDNLPEPLRRFGEKLRRDLKAVRARR